MLEDPTVSSTAGLGLWNRKSEFSPLPSRYPSWYLGQWMILIVLSLGTPRRSTGRMSRGRLDSSLVVTTPAPIMARFWVMCCTISQLICGPHISSPWPGASSLSSRSIGSFKTGRWCNYSLARSSLNIKLLDSPTILKTALLLSRFYASLRREYHPMRFSRPQTRMGLVSTIFTTSWPGLGWGWNQSLSFHTCENTVPDCPTAQLLGITRATTTTPGLRLLAQVQARLLQQISSKSHSFFSCLQQTRTRNSDTM